MGRHPLETPTIENNDNREIHLHLQKDHALQALDSDERQRTRVFLEMLAKGFQAGGGPTCCRDGFPGGHSRKPVLAAGGLPTGWAHPDWSLIRAGGPETGPMQPMQQPLPLPSR